MTESLRTPLVLLAPLVAMLLFIALLWASEPHVLRFALAKLRGERALWHDQREVVATLAKYNSILADFYASGGVPMLLDEFPASKLMRHGVFRDLGYISRAERILVYDMADSVPVTVKVTSPYDAEAVLFEEWNYMYQRRSDRRPLTPPKGMGSGFRYRLHRAEGKWQVYAWDPVTVEKPKQQPDFMKAKWEHER